MSCDALKCILHFRTKGQILQVCYSILCYIIVWIILCCHQARRPTQGRCFVPIQSLKVLDFSSQIILVIRFTGYNHERWAPAILSGLSSLSPQWRPIFARLDHYKPPPEFPLASPCSSIIHHRLVLSPTARAPRRLDTCVWPHDSQQSSTPWSVSHDKSVGVPGTTLPGLCDARHRARRLTVSVRPNCRQFDAATRHSIRRQAARPKPSLRQALLTSVVDRRTRHDICTGCWSIELF